MIFWREFKELRFVMAMIVHANVHVCVRILNGLNDCDVEPDKEITELDRAIASHAIASMGGLK